jgi:uridine nucleosidase
LNGLSSEPTVLRRILYVLVTFFASTYKTVFGLNTGPPLHDPLAVAVILSNLNPSFAKSHPGKALKFNDHNGERFVVNVVTDGKHGKDASETGQLGRTVVEPATGGGVAITRGVDLDAFWDLIADCIQRADNWNAANGRK